MNEFKASKKKPTGCVRFFVWIELDNRGGDLVIDKRNTTYTMTETLFMLFRLYGDINSNRIFITHYIYIFYSLI